VDSVFGTWGSVRIDEEGDLLAAVTKRSQLIQLARSFEQACRLPSSSCARLWSGHLTLGEHSAAIPPGVAAEVGDFTALGFVFVPEMLCGDHAVEVAALRLVRRAAASGRGP
jgi:hypothetical protein